MAELWKCVLWANIVAEMDMEHHFIGTRMQCVCVCVRNRFPILPVYLQHSVDFWIVFGAIKTAWDPMLVLEVSIEVAPSQEVESFSFS